ncbi:hypothetical protein GCM10011514_00570 [Emticicia aquatilis]|uniref:Uncharacterized protein n=2 Tax=Emticicia aquatilis TaxID=1537369 RepID=A0A917DJ21_9BACT|nr:hypothetical protein GCM10011514_00570 [Emticicia aquatilis]
MFVFSCDVTREDSVGNIVTNEENPSNVFYTLVESNLSIDPTAFEKLKLANSLVVSQVPKNGEAKFLQNGFVFYRATNPDATNDAFIISGKVAAGSIVSEEIKINFVSSQLDLPCYAGTIGDKVSVEIGQSTEINVIANDKTCGMISENSLKIEIPPANGKAEIKDRKVVYTPNQDFIGDDIFFYRLGINNTKNPVAPVELSITESKDCITGMTDDIINVLSYTPDTDLALNVLQNDLICPKYQKADLRIIKNPAIGTLRVDKNNAGNSVIYFKSATTPKGIQTFEYALYRTEKAFVQAKVTINFN